MKTAIVIDSLIKRDDATFLLELVLNVFPNSEIYTIAHKRGGILGPVESRPIVSSYLSHKSQDPEVLKKNFWILPSAVKGIPFHPSIEKVIVLSRGYVHGLVFPDHIERFLYIVDWDLIDQDKLGWWQKLFRTFVNDWRERALTRYPKIAVSSEALKARLHLPNAQVIAATYRTEEYPFVRDEDHNFDFTHHLLYTHGLAPEEFQSIAEFLLKKDETVRVLGPDEHLKHLIAPNPKLEFGGDHCEATCSMYSHQAKVIWDLSSSFFPSRAFGAFATGRPVIVRDTEVNREYLTQNSTFISDTTSGELDRVYQDNVATFGQVDRKALRRIGLKWNERLFKSRMVKFLERASD